MAQIFGERIVVLEPALLTVDTSAYAAGDLVGKHAGGKLVFGPPFGAGRGGRLVQVILGDASAQKAALDLVLFSVNPEASTFTDNAAFTLAPGDHARLIAIVPLAAASYKDFGSGRAAIVASVDNLSLVLGSTGLYGCLVSRGTPTYTAADALTLRLVIERD